jgi:hypothetical protein
MNGGDLTGCDKLIYKRKESKLFVARLHFFFFPFKIASVD